MAGLEISNLASPPDEATVQISPPETKAISLPSGEYDGSERYGFDVCERTWWLPADKKKMINIDSANMRREELINSGF